MKRSIIEMVVGLGVVAMALSCAQHSAAPKPAVAQATVSEKGEIMPVSTDFEGTVGKIDANKGLITVQHWPLSKTFKVPPECEIDLVTNTSAALNQLKVDEAVTVTYSEVGQDLVANRIVRKGKAHDKEREEKFERLEKMLNPSPNQ
jgi:Cu/Ag efflux protein CusF